LGLFIYLTPLIPLSFKGEGERYRRGASPLLNAPDYHSRDVTPPLFGSPYNIHSFKGEGEDIKRRASSLLNAPCLWLFSKGIKKDESPFKNSLLSPLTKERWIKGEGLVKISLS